VTTAPKLVARRITRSGQTITSTRPNSLTRSSIERFKHSGRGDFDFLSSTIHLIPPSSVTESSTGVSNYCGSNKSKLSQAQ
jgi:hypothetical protein